MEGALASTSSPSASSRRQLRTVEDIHISLKQNAGGRRQWSEGIKEQIFSWHFDVFGLEKTTGGNPLITVAITLLEVYGLLDDWKLKRETIEAYLHLVEAEYNPNSYHNNIHGADVTQTVAVILKSLETSLSMDIPKMDLFCLIVGASVHDLGHLGVNNDFLINSKHPRATTYNDKAVNENFHISRAFELARTMPGCDIFEGFTVDEAKKCRKLMIDTVLATDMAIHFDLLKNFSSQLETQPDVLLWADRSLFYQMLLHLADIANPSRPFPLARGWAERVIVEFCEQGDKEASIGLPVSPFCNRANMNMPKAQQGFINVFLKPTLLTFSKVSPDFTFPTSALEYLEKTIKEWQALEAQGFKM